MPNPKAANFEQLSRARLLQGKDCWTRARRYAALQRWQAIAPPTRRSEEYRYTGLREVLANDYHLAKRAGWVVPDDYRPYLADNERIYVFVDGFFDGMMSSSPIKGITTLSSAIANDDRYLRDIFDDLPLSDDYFQLLNDICFVDGLFIQAKREHIFEPIHLLFITTDDNHGQAVFCRNIIDVDVDASLDIIESHIGFGKAHYLSSTHTLINVRSGGRCAHVRWQNEGVAGQHFSTTICRQKRSSELNLLSLSQGGQLARLENIVTHLSSNSRCDFRALYCGKDKQVLDNISRIEHRAPASVTSQRLRGLVKDQAQAIFAGNIVVQQAAQQTDASQLSKSLLIGGDCAVYLRPQLQISADDVKCSHGATSSRISDEDLFYLKSRGVSHDTAVNLMCLAHIAELANDLAIPSTSRFFELLLHSFLNRNC